MFSCIGPHLSVSVCFLACAGSARSVAFSDDKNLIAIGCSDWMVRLYDAKTGLPPKWGGVLSSHWGIVTCLAFVSPFPVPVSPHPFGISMLDARRMILERPYPTLV